MVCVSVGAIILASVARLASSGTNIIIQKLDTARVLAFLCFCPCVPDWDYSCKIWFVGGRPHYQPTSARESCRRCQGGCQWCPGQPQQHPGPSQVRPRHHSPSRGNIRSPHLCFLHLCQLWLADVCSLFSKSKGASLPLLPASECNPARNSEPEEER